MNVQHPRRPLNGLPSTLFAAVLSTFGAQAQESTSVLSEIVVTPTQDGPLPASRILTSVDVMSADRIQDRNVMNSWELLGQMPGIQLTEFRLGAESGKPSFRAFNGEGYINGIKLLIDGVPGNVNSGNLRFLDMIFPREIEHVEVVRGTNDPRYGLHNIGGNIHVVTRQGGNATEARMSYGSFNTKEIQAGLARESGGWSQNYFFAAETSDGHRAHSASEKYALSGKWFYSPAGSNLQVGLIARAYRNNAQEAGYLTAAELAADRYQSPAKNANDHDRRTMRQLSAHLDYRFNDRVSLNSRLYHNAIDDDRFVTYTSNAASSAPRQRRHWVESHVGWMNTVTWTTGKSLVIEGGFNLEHQDNRFQRFRYAFASPTDFSAPVLTANSEDYTLDNLGAYVQAVYKPAERWKIVPAIRVDRFAGHSRNIATGASVPLQDYGWIRQPKLSVVYSPSVRSSLYANWGRTFQVLTGSTTPAYLTAGTATYRPSVNTGYEIGAKVTLFEALQARLALWRQDATDEVANLPSAGATLNLGQTRRKGVDIQVTAHPAKGVKLWVSHSIQEAVIKGGYTVGGASLEGKEVFSTPRHISNLGLEVRPVERLRLGLEARAQGSYYIDDLNARGKFGGYSVVDGSLRYDVSGTVSVDLQMRNLFDRKIEYVWYDNFFWPAGSFQPMFSPAPGRSAYLSLGVKL